MSWLKAVEIDARGVLKLLAVEDIDGWTSAGAQSTNVVVVLRADTDDAQQNCCHCIARCFIVGGKCSGTRRAPVARKLERKTSWFFVLGAPVSASLLAAKWVRTPSMTDGVGKPTTAAKQHSPSSLTKALQTPATPSRVSHVLSFMCRQVCSAF